MTIDKPSRRIIALSATILAVTALLTACSSDGGSPAASGDTVSVDVNTGTPIELPKGKLRVALLMAYTTDAWTQNFQSTLEDAVKANGDEIKVYDARGNQNTQNQQAQTIASNKSADVVIVQPFDGTAACNTMTKELPAANVAVINIAGILCDRTTNVGDEMYAPGTLTFVGGEGSVSYREAYARNVQKANPGPQKVLVVDGPELAPVVKASVAGAKQVSADNPDFQIEGVLYTDYTTPDAYAKTVQYIKAHPDITLIMATYSPDLTRGVITGLQAEGYSPGDIKIADVGGSDYSFQMLSDGWLQSTQAYTPITTAEQAVKAYIDAQAGKKLDKVTTDVPADLGTLTDPVTITSENMAQFTPQY